MLQDVFSVLLLGSVYALFALGMSLVWGTVKVLNFAHGATFMFAAFLCSLLASEVHVPIVVLAVVGAGIGAVISCLTEVLVFDLIKRRAKSQHDAQLQILIAGVGVATVMVSIAQHKTLSNPFGFDRREYPVSVHDLGAVNVSNVELLILICSFTLSALLVFWVSRSRNGLALRAIGVNSEIASLMGINERRLSLLAMTAAGALAGLAGVLLTFQLTAITPESGDLLLVKAFAAVVLGGIGSLTGTVLGCFILALCETLVLIHTDGEWVDAVSFALIFVVLLVRPNGLFGRAEVSRS